MTATLAILGGDAVVGRALEALLQGLGYETLLIEEYGGGKPEELPRGIQLLLAAPTADAESRERFLAAMRSTPRTAAIPVLTLSTVVNQDMTHQPGLVLWPCRMEDLRTEIEAALLAAPAEGVSSRPAESLPSATEPQETPEGASGSNFSPRLPCGTDP